MKFSLARFCTAAICFALVACGGGEDSSSTTPEAVPGASRRFGSFETYNADGSETFIPASRQAQDGSDYALTEIFGDTTVDLIPTGTGKADGQVFGSANGKTYWASAEAPNFDTTRRVGGSAHYSQSQRYIKRHDTDTLELEITAAFIEANDDSSPDIFTFRECPWRDTIGAGACDQAFVGSIDFSYLVVTSNARAQDIADAFAVGRSRLQLQGFAGNWKLSAFVIPNFVSDHPSPIWKVTDFELEQISKLAHVRARLRQTKKVKVDLSKVPLNKAFDVFVSLDARVRKQRENEGTALAAYIRDPVSGGGNISIHTSGLEQAAAPDAPPVGGDPRPAPACTGAPNPAAGTLQFEAANFAIPEWSGALSPVVVTRTGGSSGEVSAKFTTRDGTASSNGDYTPVEINVWFGDGDTEPRVVIVPITHDTLPEPEKTVNLALSEPAGCAALGAQATAVLTILDDDRPPPTGSFTVGGTVSGLAGSGLQLVDASRALRLPIATNGAFTFAAPLPGGTAYDVRVDVQPQAPAQTCSVANGQGSIQGANVVDVVVTCVTIDVPSTGLDVTFGTAGRATLNTGSGNALVRQADGKLLIVGGDNDFRLARFNVDGTVDASFGSGGTVTTSFPGTVGTSDDEAKAAAVQADGKIVVVGVAVSGRQANGAFNQDFALARYGTDGTLDPSFGSGGLVLTDFAGFTDIAHAVVIQPDGKIIVAGQASDGSSLILGGTGSDFAVARYNADGSLDSGFGTGGKVRVHIAGNVDTAFNVARQPDGKIVVGGLVGIGSSAGLDTTGLVRLLVDGRIDVGFGNGGIVVDNAGGPGTGMALQDDGKIVLIGSGGIGSSGDDFFLVRYLANGGLDTTFGVGGAVRTDFNAGFIVGDFGRAVALQADGKIVAVGSTGTPTGSDMAVARYLADGSLDASFNNGGKLTINFPNAAASANGVVIQPDGKIVVGGNAGGYAIARVNR